MAEIGFSVTHRRRLTQNFNCLLYPADGNSQHVNALSDHTELSCACVRQDACLLLRRDSRIEADEDDVGAECRFGGRGSLCGMQEQRGREAKTDYAKGLTHGKSQN